MPYPYTGRDVEGKLVLKLDKGTGIWSLLAQDAEQYALSKAHKEILDLLGEHSEGLKPYQIAEFLDVERGAIRMRLSRMARENLITQDSNGKYYAPF